MGYSGRYQVKDKAKYRGDFSSVVYRSLWEKAVFQWCDKNEQVKGWSSEEVIVPYRSPIDGKIHRYYPDVVVHKRDGTGQPQTIMIEIKPSSQCRPPDIKNKNKTKTGRISRRYLNEVKTWGVNEAKWKAAKNFCADRGWQWTIMTEKHIPGAR